MIPKKSLGQHFLTAPAIATAMAEAVDVQKGDTVLEIGPGTGILTKALLAKEAIVFAVEKDEDQLPVLKEKFAQEIQNNTLKLFHSDIRNITPESIGIENNYKVVANIPYYITGEIIRNLFAYKKQPNSIALLMQKEVAERIARDPKESVLSLSIKAYGDPAYVRTVRKGSFFPAPSVDSAILAITNVSRKNFIDFEESHFFHIVKTAFGEKRKQVGKTLGSIISKNVLENTLKEVCIAPNQRPETIPIEKWLLIAEKTKSLMHK